MIEFITELLSSDFMPHGHCYFWNPAILWLHVGSDFLIGAAYFSIPVTLLYLVRKRDDLVFHWVFVMFAAFILACGATHFFSIWTVWHGTYRLEGILKFVTAALSITTAGLLWPLMPTILSIPSPEKLRREISERKKAEAALQELNLELKQRAEALAELDQMKSAFFNNVSHEFRTPLTLLLGPVQDLLADRTLSEAHRSQLELVNRNSHRLLKLVNTLLDFSALESGHLQPHFARTDVAALTKDLTSIFLDAAKQSGIALDLELSNEPVFASVDSTMWEKLVLNLLSNALKYTKKGSISVRLREDAGHLTLTVQDTGVGIAEEHLPRLFERFYRVHSPDNSHEGSGIGLALVRELVQLHRGSIEVESKTNSGSTFRVTLPLEQATAPKENDARNTVSSQRLSYVEDLGAADIDTDLKDLSEAVSHAPRILIAEDNADMRLYLSKIFAGRYQLTLVEDGEAALASLETQKPELIISDVMMPGLDGLTLSRKVKENPETRAIPIILLSARSAEESELSGFDSGANDYVSKPFSAKELLARVNNHLSSAKQQQEEVEAARAHLATVVDSASEGILTVSPNGTILSWNHGAEELFGYTKEEKIGQPIWPLLNEESEAAIRIVLDGLAKGQARKSEMLWQNKEGRFIPVFVSFSAIPDSKNSPPNLAIILHDISERKQAEKQQALLLAELNHRVKNTLAIVQSIANQTARFSTNMQEYQNSLEGRLSALSHAHNALTEGEWKGAALATLLRRELKPYLRNSEKNVSIEGPSLMLAPKQALALHLLVHELMVNAAKYGALSTANGKVDIFWKVKSSNSEELVHLDWIERDGPPVFSPQRQGFGSTLIRYSIENELDGHCSLDFHPHGVHCSLMFPLQAVS